MKNGIEGRRNAKPERYRNIVETAIAEFAQTGYDNTRIDDIALKSDIGKGTIYNYVATKFDLFTVSIYLNHFL